MEPTYRYSAACTASTFSADLFTMIETTDFHRLYRHVMQALRYDHSECHPQLGDMTSWELRVDGKLAYTIRYISGNWEEAELDDYTSRIFRHHGESGMKVIFRMDKED